MIASPIEVMGIAALNPSYAFPVVLLELSGFRRMG